MSDGLDPVVFVREILGIELEPWQANILRQRAPRPIIITREIVARLADPGFDPAALSSDRDVLDQAVAALESYLPPPAGPPFKIAGQLKGEPNPPANAMNPRFKI